MENSPPTTIENPNTVTENLNVEAKYVALRDVNFTQTQQQGAFVKVHTEVYEQNAYAVPSFTDYLLQKLRSNRMIIVTQPSSFDTSSLLRYIAVQFKKEQELEVLEYDSGSGATALLKEFPKMGTNKIFVLDHLHPQAIDYDLSRLMQLTSQCGDYFVISTEVSEGVWQIKRNAFFESWFAIPNSGIYKEEELCKDLIRKLEAEKENIAFIEEDEITASQFLSKEKRVSQLIPSFQNPEEINLFVYQLIGLEELPDEKKLQQFINQATDQSAPPVVKWFHALPQAQKLIVIGACLLEGVYDDQFFQLMSEIVETNWKHRDASLLALDYCDLEFLHHYFEFLDHGDGKHVLKSKYPEQRASIIEAAWDSYRRHILHALPSLVDAARNTIVSNEVNWEKFGTQQRRMAIRQAVGGTVSDIGIHSLETVEHTLLEFAAVSQVTLQRITAKAMARWREYGKDDLLFNTLERWTQSAEVEQTVEEFLKNEKISSINGANTAKAMNYIKSTSILTLGYAAAYDPPDELHEKIIELIRPLLSEREPQLRERLRVALPKLIRQHVHSLLPLITEDLVKEDDLQDLVSSSLVELYEDFPEVVQKVLKDWVDDCINNGSDNNRRQKMTHRDKVLVTALRTYQQLDLQQENSPISIPDLYDTLKILTKSEQRAAVREVVWQTLVHVLQLDYEEANKQLHKLFPDPFSREADYLVNIYCGIYFQERLDQEELTPHRLQLSKKEEELPVWRNAADRPLTNVEKGVHQLLESAVLSNRQLATKMLWKFAQKIDKEELEKLYLIPAIKREENIHHETMTPNSSRPSPSPIITSFTPKPIISWWIRLWIFLLCFQEADAQQSRTELRAFYLTLRSQGLKSEYTHFLLNRWSRNPSSSIQKMSRRLQFLIKRAW